MCSVGKINAYVSYSAEQACVLWPLNVLCDIDLWGMDLGYGQCTLSQLGQQMYKVKW